MKLLMICILLFYTESIYHLFINLLNIYSISHGFKYSPTIFLGDVWYSICWMHGDLFKQPNCWSSLAITLWTTISNT